MNERKPNWSARKTRVLCCLCIWISLAPFGCSRESLRVALDSQRQADQVQQQVFDQQHEALRVLLYRDLVRRLEGDGAALTAAQRAALSDVWNERDLLEFWAIQHERAGALRLVGVDAKLFTDQSPVDLLIKSVERRVDRVKEYVAAGVGTAVFGEETRRVEQ